MIDWMVVWWQMRQFVTWLNCGGVQALAAERGSHSSFGAARSLTYAVVPATYRRRRSR